MLPLRGVMLRMLLCCEPVQKQQAARHAAPLLSAPGTVVGIDLGTTSSAIAVILENQAEIVPDGSGRKSLPSVVEFRPLDGKAIVGYDAGSDAVSSCKRLMGRSFSDVTRGQNSRSSGQIV